ncbi:hypothetical protein NQ318_010677 [Aromia moschata]|uniref:SH2 domain-containing protein n=1 Tax=Aromia moschata TaxID=1265417 RepID=A0AAV8X3M6_9CUCU|nr:hypothetical protein NQ318_010677 [Aromia moschata]
MRKAPPFPSKTEGYNKEEAMKGYLEMRPPKGAEAHTYVCMNVLGLEQKSRIPTVFQAAAYRYPVFEVAGAGTTATRNRFHILNDEPFCRNTDRKRAMQLLRNLEDGAFLFRPSKTFFLGLTIKRCNKFYNFGLEEAENNMIRLNAGGETKYPEFASLSELVDYFIEEPIMFKEGNNVIKIFLKPLLPPDLF